MQLDRRTFLRLSALGSATLVLPLAGAGCAGAGAAAVAVRPGGPGELLFFDRDGALIELQPNAHRALIHPMSGGAPIVLGGFGAGPGQLNGPSSLAVDSQGRIYIADRGNGRVQVYRRDGQYLFGFGGPGNGAEALCYPFGVCVDAEDRVWVSDPLNHRLQRYTAEGKWLGACGEGELNAPLGLAVGPDGRMHAVEAGSGTVAVFSPSGVRVGRYGGWDLGLHSPRAIAVDAEGTSYVTDATVTTLFVFSSDGSLRERLSLSREGAPAAALHVSIGPDGTLEVATLPGAPA